MFIFRMGSNDISMFDIVFSEKQSKAILEMRLQKLRSLAIYN